MNESPTELTLLKETRSINELVSSAVTAITDGHVDPITAHINLSRMAASIKLVMDTPQVRDITLRELAKYGKKQSFGDCTLEECEAGVKYDYSLCGDSELAELENQRFALDAKIKARQQVLKHLPIQGMVNPNTGEVILPPSKSSKTIIKTIFKKN